MMKGSGVDPDPRIHASAYYFLTAHFHNFSKIKNHKSHKTVGIKVFLTILLDDRRIRIRNSD
jgi:hypothetical protein